MISYDILSSSIFVQFLKVLSTFPHLDFTMCKVHQLILRGKKNNRIHQSESKQTKVEVYAPNSLQTPSFNDGSWNFTPHKTSRLIGEGRSLMMELLCFFLFRLVSFLINSNICIFFGGGVACGVFYPWEKNWGMLCKHSYR